MFETNTGENPGNEEMNVDTAGQQEAVNQTEPTGAEEKTGKTFTQEEVDKIVEKRLNRERRKFSSMINGEDPREADLEEREKALAVRELQADAKATLAEKRLPMEALELLNYTDKESCDSSIEALEKVVIAATQERIDRVLRGGAPPKKGPSSLEEPVDSLYNIFCGASQAK